MRDGDDKHLYLGETTLWGKAILWPCSTEWCTRNLWLSIFLCNQWLGPGSSQQNRPVTCLPKNSRIAMSRKTMATGQPHLLVSCLKNLTGVAISQPSHTHSMLVVLFLYLCSLRKSWPLSCDAALALPSYCVLLPQPFSLTHSLHPGRVWAPDTWGQGIAWQSSG